MSRIISLTPHWIKTTYFAPLLLAKYRKYRYKRRYYNQEKKELDLDRKQIVFMVDGRFNHGGLSDRLWGIISTYTVCERNGWDFRINWTHPFPLSTFLIPVNHDWRIDASQISYNSDEAEPIFISNNHNEKNQLRLFEQFKKSKATQIHVYSPAHLDRDNFGVNFSKIFQPTPLLKNAIDTQLALIVDNYISITFRFQQLLGDFKEGDYPTLNEKEKTELIEKCLKSIYSVKEENPEISTVLVTSDSRTFLNEAAKIPFVHVIPGDLVHMLFTDGREDSLIHLKAFLDLFMIGNARKVYFVKNAVMYNSTFAYTAAKLLNRPYIVFNI